MTADEAEELAGTIEEDLAALAALLMEDLSELADRAAREGWSPGRLEIEASRLLEEVDDAEA